MADRPSFQFYPAEWRSNAKLRRCSPAARGAWMDVLCLLHDSDEYGVLRWPLADIANAAGVPVSLLRELHAKGVLKGADKDAGDYAHRPYHAGTFGEPVTLVAAADGPCWYCSRFVRDEWRRGQRGKSTRFSDTKQPTKASPIPSPTARVGERQGDGPSSASSSALKSSKAKDSGTDVPAAAIVDAYHRLLPRCRAVATLPDDRLRRIAKAQRNAKRLCAERGWEYGPDFWEDYFTECAKDEWMRGDKPNPNSASWKQNLDVLLSDDQFAKVMDRALEGAP